MTKKIRGASKDILSCTIGQLEYITDIETRAYLTHVERFAIERALKILKFILYEWEGVDNVS